MDANSLAIQFASQNFFKIPPSLGNVGDAPEQILHHFSWKPPSKDLESNGPSPKGGNGLQGRHRHDKIANCPAELVPYFVYRQPQMATSVNEFQSFWLLPCPTIRT